MGVGFHEAPRGVLSHWVVIRNGKIKNYQCVVPSTWNAAPRNEKDQPGSAYEACSPRQPDGRSVEKPLEVLRTVHSFDPCIKTGAAPGTPARSTLSPHQTKSACC
jgi:hydrogenase large subunit